MDINTFGNSQCAKNLVKMLEEANDEKINRLVSNFLTWNNEIINELDKMENIHVKRSLANMYRNSLDTKGLNVPEKIRTHAINVLVASLRDKKMT